MDAGQEQFAVTGERATTDAPEKGELAVEQGTMDAPGKEELAGTKDQVAVVVDEQPLCRICRAVTVTKAVINLGCACPLNSGGAHQHCAEIRFLRRGNRRCEICGEIARNVHLPGLPEERPENNQNTAVPLNVQHHQQQQIQRHAISCYGCFVPASDFDLPLCDCASRRVQTHLVLLFVAFIFINLFYAILNPWVGIPHRVYVVVVCFGISITLLTMLVMGIVICHRRYSSKQISPEA
ncbi:unnamed protein product [Calypogeia fissa]